MLISNGKSIKAYDTTGNFVQGSEAMKDSGISLRVEEDMVDNKNEGGKHVSASWDRCINMGLSPEDQPRFEEVPYCQLELLIEKYSVLQQVAEQYIIKMSLILPKSCIIGLGNGDGILFYVSGNAPELEKMGYKPGYIHTESNFGNNALGTCIYTKEPTAILGSEHFLKALAKWGGFGAPIYNVDDELEAVLMLMMPKELANQNILGIVMVAARGIEKELRLIYEKSQLANANEMLLEFGDGIIETAAMLSHEVKNSLSNISAYIQLLQLEKILDNNRSEKILKEISRITKLVYDFKRLTKPIQMSLSYCSLNDILQSIVEIMKPKANMNGVQFNISIPEEPIYMKADKNALKQVFMNIVENAIQAMEDGGLLYIKLKSIGKRKDTVISFRDTGHGIPEEQLDQIFKLFYTTKETGSGLGLALCQSIIKYHGGEINVASIVGQGTTFTIKFTGTSN